MEAIITGVLKVIKDTERFQITGNSNFEKRECVIETQGDFPQSIQVEFSKGNTTHLLDSYGIGEKVSIHVNIKGRKWTNAQGVDKYFVSLQGYKIEPYND